MILRLASGSATPASAAMKGAAASTCTTLACSRPANISITSCASFSRSSAFWIAAQVKG